MHGLAYELMYDPRRRKKEEQKRKKDQAKILGKHGARTKLSFRLG